MIKIKYKDMVTRDWLEIIMHLLNSGVEIQASSGIDYYLESITDDEMIIRFNDEKATSFIIKKCS